MPTPERPHLDSYTCTRCGIHKPRTEFYTRKNRKSGCTSECKSCHKERVTKRYKEDPDLANDRRAARTYGVDLSYIQNLREQANGICQCCGRPGLHHHKRLVIDHDHITGRVRGLICSNCNSILGFCDDNITTLENLISYLNK